MSCQKNRPAARKALRGHSYDRERGIAGAGRLPGCWTSPSPVSTTGTDSGGKLGWNWRTRSSSTSRSSTTGAAATRSSVCGPRSSTRRCNRPSNPWPEVQYLDSTKPGEHHLRSRSTSVPARTLLSRLRAPGTDPAPGAPPLHRRQTGTHSNWEGCSTVRGPVRTYLGPGMARDRSPAGGRIRMRCNRQRIEGGW